jgi:hypothetical protein
VITVEDFIIRAAKYGEIELGPNVLFDAKYGRYYGFSWVTGPQFAATMEALLEKMVKHAANRRFRPYRKVFVIERHRHDSGQYAALDTLKEKDATNADT